MLSESKIEGSKEGRKKKRGKEKETRNRGNNIFEIENCFTPTPVKIQGGNITVIIILVDHGNVISKMI